MRKIVIFITLILALLMCMASCSIVLPSGSTSESEPEHTHDFGEWFISESATCTKDGLTVCYCSCGEKLSETIKRLPHTVVVDKGSEPTCTETGLTEGKHCSVCNEIIVEQEILPVRHTEVIDAAVNPTCTETGLTEGKHCSVCNEVLVAQTLVDALGHTESEATIENNVDSTCTTVGSYDCAVYCSTCGDELSRQTITGEVINHNIVDGICDMCGEVIYTREGDYIYFGEYPQAIKADNVTITDIQDSRGYYLGSDGVYYAAVTATPCDSNYTFSTGDTVSEGDVYYFKVEPIRWRILYTDGETAFILCDSVIANHRFDDDSSNYADSEIRQWLNSTFYETAFTDLQCEVIRITLVDNSAESTGNSENLYACEDTEDKIFLLSYAEVISDEYGFYSDQNAKDTSRMMQTSDYSRATGAFVHFTVDNMQYNGNGWWLLRSPAGGYFNFASRNIYSDGHLFLDNVNSSRIGIVPAMWIDLNP